MINQNETTEQTLVSFFNKVRAEEQAPSDFWSAISARLAAHPHAGSTLKQSSRPRLAIAAPWAGAPLLLTLTIAVVVFFTVKMNQPKVASAEQILRKAQATAASPSSAGILSIHVTQEETRFFLGESRREVQSLVIDSEAWYQSPNRQRLDSNAQLFSLQGQAGGQISDSQVWDGHDYWRNRGGTIYRYTQDPRADVYEQGIFRSETPGSLADVYGSACRSATRAGEDVVAGRRADIVELGRAICGVPFPGSDGKTELWVDKDTGLVLKTEQFAADGKLYSVREVTSIELGTHIPSEILTFTPPSGADVVDLRDQPTGFGTLHPLQSKSISLEQARKSVSFSLLIPSRVPEGFHLESVEEYYSELANGSQQPQIQWILLRYTDSAGNWLVIGDGPGGNTVSDVADAPSDFTGTVDINGKLARWIDGWPSGAGWEAGVRSSLTWQDSRTGSSYEISPDGGATYGTGVMIGLSSNSLSVGELITTARSMN